MAVVGAGMAGLTLAAALARHGIECRVFEQTGGLAAVGAGIQLSPNGTRPLLELGLGPALDRVAARPGAIEVRRWDDGRLLTSTVLGADCERAYRAPYLTVHRADLQRCLLDAVPAGVVRLGRRCVGVRELDGTARVEFADGSVAEADVVVGADGIRSVVRGCLVEDAPRPSGQAVFRGVVDIAAVPGISGGDVSIWVGPGRHCVCYPISAGRRLSFAASTPAGDWREESWSVRGEVSDLLAAYTGWSPVLRALLAAPESVSRWALHDRPEPARWSGARTTLVGDAAHPMLPFGAQGLSQGVEDAVTLAALLARSSADTVPHALRRYERIRRPRVARVRRFVADNQRDHHLLDGPGQHARDRTLDDDWELDSRAWLFGHDAERVAAAVGRTDGARR
ncbi:salicylate 1-monooxygenase [Actinophytocola xanthii]|uniref:Salicylate 1-monooxygenase n=1 Tax=Actinophytocola xanthii TaxID=1912961 RepID=A0A1Q8C5B3_9PSEU|nr:salicylate 1-monooxygenase [Actinophytocola xanthii]